MAMTSEAGSLAPGEGRIAAAFARAAARGSAALMPYYTLGYPDRETSLEVIAAIAPESDLLELGVPFSDPLADGPTIQHSTQQALVGGTTTAGCLEMVAALRARGMMTPALLMGYTNPILAYGEAAYVRDAAAAGADGFIVPDLPPEEAGELEALAAAAGLVLVPFLAPTSDPARVRRIAARARGFVYMVSLTGVTGTDEGPDVELASFVERVKAQATVPVAVGFGIKTAAQAAAVGRYADGVIVGSALIRTVDEAIEATGEPAAAARDYVAALRAALLAGSSGVGR
jgi:tryptophan synthase alpha chain